MRENFGLVAAAIIGLLVGAYFGYDKGWSDRNKSAAMTCIRMQIKLCEQEPDICKKLLTK